MAKMNIAPKDRPRVKSECLRLLATLQLDPAWIMLLIFDNLLIIPHNFF